MRHLWTRGLQATAPRQQQLLHVEQAYFHPFGPGTQRLYDSPLSWSIELDPSQVWAVTGPGASSFLTAVLLGRSRTEPLLSRSWPLLLNSNATVQDVVSKVAFKTRLKGFGAMSQIGEFADYTARFGALLEEDKVTLLQHFEDFLTENNLPVDHEHIQDVSGRLNLTNLLQRPLIGLSNGQTRRARIARALLKKPRVLVLEEPFCRF